MGLLERALSANTNFTNSGTSIDVTPTGQQEGDDIFIGVMAAGGTGAHSVSAGGLSRATAADIAMGTVGVASTWRKKCGPSESGTTYTIAVGATRRIVVVAVCYSGGDTDIVEDAPAGDVSGASASSLAVTGVDPAGLGYVHLLFLFSRTAAAVAQDFDPVTDYPELTAEVSSTSAGSTNANVVPIARALPDANATGTVTFSVTSADRLAGASILLRPAPPSLIVPSFVSQYGSYF